MKKKTEMDHAPFTAAVTALTQCTIAAANAMLKRVDEPLGCSNAAAITRRSTLRMVDTMSSLSCWETAVQYVALCSTAI